MRNPANAETTGRNTRAGPAFQQSDFSVLKMIPVSERTSLQFRAEPFNIFNNVKFRFPDNDLSSSDFG